MSCLDSNARTCRCKEAPANFGLHSDLYTSSVMVRDAGVKIFIEKNQICGSVSYIGTYTYSCAYIM